MHICVSVSVLPVCCQCVCVCVSEREREREKESESVRVWQGPRGRVCCGGLDEGQDGCVGFVGDWMAVSVPACVYVLGCVFVLCVEAVQPLPNSHNSTNQPALAAEAA